MIPYGRQDINEKDINAIVEVLTSDWLTQGPAIERFENAISNHCGNKYSIAVSNATAALHIACLALDLGPGDYLWTSPITFVASANCGLYCGAKVDFVDIDPRTYNISIDALRAKLEWADKNGTLPKVIIPVHFAGQSCDMCKLHALANHYRFSIIEDASHAIGGLYENDLIGNCRYSNITVFSFHPVKIITTGEGGMAMTNDLALANRMRRLRTHGITRNLAMMESAENEPWYYEQMELGYNFRMTDIQAALGSSQLRRLNSFVTRRKKLADRYDILLEDLPITLPWQDTKTNSARHLYVIRLKLEEISRNRRQVFEAMRKAGVGVNVHYIPVHTQPFYQTLGFRLGMYPEAERYYDEAITLPLFPTMTEQQQDYIVEALQESLE